MREQREQEQEQKQEGSTEKAFASLTNQPQEPEPSRDADVLRALVLAACEDLGRYGLAPTPASIAAVASLVVNASRLGRSVDEADAKRLNAIERWGIAYHGPEANGEDCVQLTGPCHEDAEDCDDECTDETRAYRWEVTGPPCADGFGNSIGSGVSLRAAIDDALLEETNPSARKVTR